MGKVEAKGRWFFFTWIKQPAYVSAVSRLKQAEKSVYIQIIVGIKALL